MRCTEPGESVVAAIGVSRSRGEQNNVTIHRVRDAAELGSVGAMRKPTIIFSVCVVFFLGLAAFNYLTVIELDSALRSSYQAFGFPVTFIRRYPNSVRFDWLWFVFDLAVIVLFSYKITSFFCRRKKS
jgi:hypothetical protein